jgi:hypothetical protein
MHNYYFKRNDSSTASDFSNTMKASWVFDIDEFYNIKCVKDIYNDYQHKIFPTHIKHDQLTKNQRKFLCDLLLETNVNSRLKQYISHIIIDYIIVILLRGAYNDTGKRILNKLRIQLRDIKPHEYLKEWI